MREIEAGLFIALDGVVEAPDQWHLPYVNDEMGAAVGALLAEADTLLLGRVTYDTFAGAWPDREAEGGEDAGFAQQLGRSSEEPITRLVGDAAAARPAAPAGHREELRQHPDRSTDRPAIEAVPPVPGTTTTGTRAAGTPGAHHRSEPDTTEHRRAWSPSIAGDR